VAAKYAVDINGATEIALTKLDVLSGMDKIKVCTGYTIDEEAVDFFPDDALRLERCKPVFTEFPGWEGDLSQAKTFEELPQATRGYIGELEKLTGCRVRYVSTGPQRVHFIDRGDA
jgi:adenylosuccinate synthase